MVRKWGEFAVQRDPERLLFAGVLFENVPVPADALYAVVNAPVGRAAFLGNLGRGRVRAYLEAHDRYYEVIHTLENWFSDLFMEVGGDAKALKGK